jgi:hypothetical protein
MSASVFLMVLTLSVETDFVRDFDRFPPYEVARLNNYLSACHLRWVECQTHIGPSMDTDYVGKRTTGYLFEVYSRWQEDAEYSFKVWNALEAAQYTSGPIGQRKIGFTRLRVLIGDEAYVNAYLPGPVPLSWFQRR